MSEFKIAVERGESKVSKIYKSPFSYLLQCILAGMYLTFIGLVFWYIKEILKESAGIASIISGLFFGLGLTIIMFLKADLFTSNNMYLAMSTFMKKTTIKDTIYLWTVCWIGNFIGAIIMALLVYNSGFFEKISPDFVMYKASIAKVSYPIVKLIFKGILANWVVCLAAWIYLHLKNEVAQLMLVVLVISTFLILGFEHSIANMGTFSYTFLSSDFIDINDIFYNLLWSTLGNIIGGAVFMGLPYYLLDKKH